MAKSLLNALLVIAMDYRKYSFFLILALSMLRLFTFNVNEGYWWDETVYLSLAKNMHSFKGFQVAGFEQFRLPFFPFLISLSFFVFNSVISAKMLMFVFYLLSLVSIYLLAETFFDETTAFFSVLFLGSNALFLFFSYKILAESLFACLVCLSALFFHKKHPAFGFFTALACMTKHFAWLLIPVFIVFSLKDKKFIFSSALIFLITLTPFFYLNIKNYNNPLGNLIENFSVYSGSKHELTDVLFYIKNSYAIFGISLPFIIYSFFTGFDTKKKLFLCLSFIPLAVFSFLSHNEQRYIAGFMPFFFVLCSCPISNLVKNFSTVFLALLAVLILMPGLSNGFSSVFSDRLSGKTIVDACSYIDSNFNSYKIITLQYSYASYFTDNEVVILPADENKFYSIADSNTVILYYLPEPGNPAYLKNITGFSEIISFKRDWEETKLFV